MQRNLALGKKVSNMINAHLVTDGDKEQYDGRNGFGECSWPCDVILDLEEICVIDFLNLYLWDKDYRFYYYRVFVSKDNKTWMVIADNSTKQSRGVQTINAEQKKARYIKIECLYNSANRAFHLVQLEVIGTPVSEGKMLERSSETKGKKSYDIFLSYSTSDQTEANQIYQAVIKAGGSIFLSEKSLKPGQDFADEIRNSIKASKEVWIIVSPNSLKSEWVTTECGAAWALNKTIIPILFRCSPDQLPDRLRSFHCIDLHKIEEFIREKYNNS